MAIKTYQQWAKRGQYLEMGPHRVFCVSEGDHEETLLILHGFPTFSYDYQHVLPTLAKHYRVIIHDHLGFGLSDKPLNYSYSLIEQADVALDIWRQLGITQAHLAAHDYGTSIATELVARYNQGHRPVKFDSITLCNGSVHIELSQLRPIQKLLLNRRLGPLVAKLSSKKIFKRNMKQLWYQPDLLVDDELEVMWEMLIRENGRAVMPRLIHYIRERKLFWHRWIGGLINTTIPVNILWADRDPVAVPTIAQTLHDEIEGSQLFWLKDIGHYPMIEAPEQWSEGLIRLIKEV